ncbi:MAG: tRNA (adenosine(37)-N6)-dimethylallyltransferase MiaA [Candidatus Brocadiae bacterium]|nr:tRNA (adenosine(37)-N6)-dimethylallyltransferase MiaA [Candidatus Brocadiia bacterium]
MAIPLLIISGPTASGKTELSLALAKALDAEILYADSMTIYKGMNIGTAKPSLEERSLIPHHLIDIRDPWQAYSAGDFVEEAHRIILQIHERGKKVVLTGGTTLYIKSLLEGIFTGPPADWDIRKKLMEKDPQSLYQELCECDPESAAKVSPNDSRRVIRSLEVYYASGVPITQLRKENTKPPGDYMPFFLGMEWDRPVLYQRIEQRIDRMLAQGLIEETRNLLQLPYPLSHTASKAIGYKETIEALHDPAKMPGLADQIKINTRHFAKHQMTWLRRFPIQWIQATLGKDTVVQICLEKYFSFIKLQAAGKFLQAGSI